MSGSKGFIPAYAGSTDGKPCNRLNMKVHPRIRGVHWTPDNGNECMAGSSPHTRGPLIRGEIDMMATGFIPAYAGSTQRVQF